MSGPLASRQECLGIFLGFERLVARGFDCGLAGAKVPHHPEGGFRRVGVNFPLAVHDDADPNTLHPACTEFGPDLAPQHRAEVKSHEAVQDASGLLGVHQIDVHLTRRFDRLQDGGLGDLGKHDALGLLGLQSERLHEVPADGLSFTVLIRREPHHLGFLRQGFQLGHHLFARGADLVLGGEIVLDVDAFVALGQVPDVPHGRLHHEVFAEVAFNGFRLGGRLYNDEVFGHGGGFGRAN